VTGLYRRLARNRDFTILWAGETVSELGSSMSLFVFPLVAYAVTQSVLSASLAEAAYAGGRVVFLLPAGAWVDRMNRKTVMLASSGSGVVLYGSLAVAGAAWHLTLVHLLVVALATGVASAFFRPAETAAVHQIVASEDLPTALSQNQARQAIAALAGGPLGGALFSLARWLPFAVDAVSFAVSCLTLSRLRAVFTTPPSPDAPRSLRRDIREGLAFNWHNGFLRATLIFAAVANMASQAFFLALVLRMLQAHVHPTLIGFFWTAGGVAGILGALTAPYLMDRFPTGPLSLVTAWAMTIATIPMAFTVNPLLLGLLAVPVFFVIPIPNTAVATYRIAITPERLQGRGQTAMNFVASIASPVGPLLGGWMLSTIGGSTAMLLLAGVLALSPLALTLSRDVRAVPVPAIWREQLANEGGIP
jgi:MFS family permease